MPHRSHRSQKPPRAPAAGSGPPQRLQKLLASAGVGSRRECEQLIVDGRVEVDRKVVSELGAKADPQRQEIRLDGELLHLRRPVHFMLNKPPGVVSTHRDPAGRPRVVDLIDASERLFTVGRLDKSSQGLIVVTNDGQLANRLAHPRYEVTKTYVVTVAGTPGADDLRQLRAGVHLAEAFVRPVSVRVKRRGRHSTELEIVLAEGRNREIRRMLARQGHKVLTLNRIALGPLRLGDLPLGAHRQLTAREVAALRQATSRSSQRSGATERPQPDEMFTITPRPASIIAGTSARQT